jgi:hypothetical protein
MTDKCGVDQRQVKADIRGYANWTWWYAQSFTPANNMLAKIELGLSSWSNVNVTISVRDTLNGNDIVVATAVPPIGTPLDTIWWWNIPDWAMFDLSDIEVIPGKEYFIVCRVSGAVVWLFGEQNPYDRGQTYYSLNAGDNWIKDPGFDACFVTYG